MMSTQGFKERTRDLTQLGPSPSRVVRLRLGQATWDSTKLGPVPIQGSEKQMPFFLMQIPPPQLPIHNVYSSNLARISLETNGDQTQFTDHAFPTSRDWGGLDVRIRKNLWYHGFGDSRYCGQHSRFSNGSLLQERRFNEFDAVKHAGNEGSNCIPNNNLNFLGSSSVGRQGAILPSDQRAFNHTNHSMPMNVYGKDQNFLRSSP